MEAELSTLLRTALVALAALLPITNPPGNAANNKTRLTTSAASSAPARTRLLVKKPVKIMNFSVARIWAALRK